VKINKITTLILVALLFLATYLAFQHVTLTHNINSQGIIYPEREWVLARGSDGNLISSLKNHFNNSISHYTVTEFQRGDLAQFTVLDGIFDKGFVKRGDTIGFIQSSAEDRKLIELYGHLEEQKSMLALYASGEKPEQIRVAEQRLELARQEYESQKRITERNRVLFERNHIAEEEYEISENAYQASHQNYLIAQSQLQALTSGAKSEQLQYIRTSIENTKRQIEHLETLLQSFYITAPFSGKIIRKQGASDDYEAIFRMADTTAFMLATPIELYQYAYLSKGQKIRVNSPLNGETFTANVSGFDNSIQMIDRRQKIFVNALIDPQAHTEIMPNMLVTLSIQSEPITLTEYIRRFFNEVYNN